MSPSIVVLTDFFAVSNRALSYAAGLAVPLNAHLVLLHARHDELLAPSEFSRMHTRRGERKTTIALQRLASEQPVPAEVDIAVDLLPDALKEVVDRHQPLLVVLGHAGAATTPPETLTQTTLNLLRQVHCPLLLVPPVGWDAFPPRRLLLAIDGQPFRLYPHHDVVRHLVQAMEATLAVVQVTDDEHSRPAAGEVLRTVQANHLVDSLPADALHQVYHAHIATGVLETAAQAGHEADMLVVVGRRHSFLGSLFHESVTAELVRTSPIPVLLLPAED